MKKILFILLLLPILGFAQEYHFGYDVVGTAGIALLTDSNTFAVRYFPDMYTADGTETIDSLVIYGKSYNTLPDTLEIAIYTISLTDSLPRNLVYQDTILINSSSGAWEQLDVNIPLMADSTYTIALLSSDGGYADRIFYDVADSGMIRDLVTRGSFDTFWSTGTISYSNYRYSVYAVYSKSGTPASKIIRYRNVRLKGVK